MWKREASRLIRLEALLGFFFFQLKIIFPCKKFHFSWLLIHSITRRQGEINFNTYTTRKHLKVTAEIFTPAWLIRQEIAIFYCYCDWTVVSLFFFHAFVFVIELINGIAIEFRNWIGAGVFDFLDQPGLYCGLKFNIVRNEFSMETRKLRLAGIPLGIESF